MKRFLKGGLAFALALLIFAAAVPSAWTYFYDLIKDNVLIRKHLDVKGPATFEDDATFQDPVTLDDPVFEKRGRKEVLVNTYTQLSLTEGGASVYVIDPALGNIFKIDLAAIVASASPTTASGLTGWTVTGLTVMQKTPTALTDGYQCEIVAEGSGTSPLSVWQPTENDSGTTVAGTLRALDPAGNWVTGASTYRIDKQGDSQGFEYGYNAGVSVRQTKDMIGT